MQDDFELSRRKALAALGTIGVASAGAGLGTSAYFSDQETFENNRLMAGTLDMKAAYSAHYSDWSTDEDGGDTDSPDDDVDVVMWDGPPGSTGGPTDAPVSDDYTGLPSNDAWLIAVDDPDQFLANTQTNSAGNTSCPDGTDAEDLAQPVIDLSDVKPGDFGEVTFDFTLCDNPGYIWLQGELVSCAENGTTEPEEDDPDEASMLPLAAVGGASASSLLDTDTRQEVVETVGEAIEGDRITRKSLLKTAGAGAAGVASAGAMTGTAAAAPGDNLGTVSLSNGTGVGMTFTGTYVITPRGFSSDVVDIWEPPTAPNGSATLVASKTLPSSLPGEGTDTISGVDWDPDRQELWATYDGDPFLLIDLGDLTVTETLDSGDVSNEFSAPSDTTGWPADGVAYDRRDDTIWWSSDASQETVQINTDGTVANRITPEVNAAGDLFDNNSGIAVGGDMDGRKTLYLGNNPSDANGGVIRVFADTGEYISDFATGTGFRVEALVCDPVTYDFEALLIMDADTNEYRVFEAPAGICPIGGDPDPEPEPEPDQCADVELLDAVEAAAWVDDGNNYQNDGESFVVRGSLRSVLNELSSGTGVTLPGTIPAEQGGGTGSQGCFPAETTASVAFAWWVPTDHGNEIQTDSATFNLNFYTEQCRHNDGSGMNNAMVNDDEIDDS
ncbi:MULTISPECIES: SipW-dependent-type signal peptide-containing protein [Haloplanus]|jgi:predicted ribosomally synthesized peptide with SipW-like signal peptide|uniref:SipW-dependent-type signal peptide-containing protein n=1 Tax=Haloplanus TaxID=376170 RepID=UPI001E6354C2|nr:MULTISPECIES: SipW-dependent-type signal peptide-containing protein [Haloplanus]